MCDPAGSRICRHDLLSIINSGVWAPILTPTQSSMIISDEPRCQDSINPIYIFPSSRDILLARDSIVGTVIPSSLVHSKYFTRSVIRYHFVINSLTTCLQAVLISITEWARSISLRLGRDKSHLDTYNPTDTFRSPERHLYDHPLIG